jgi:hypothetical protein
VLAKPPERIERLPRLVVVRVVLLRYVPVHPVDRMHQSIDVLQHPGAQPAPSISAMQPDHVQRRMQAALTHSHKACVSSAYRIHELRPCRPLPRASCDHAERHAAQGDRKYKLSPNG